MSVRGRGERGLIGAGWQVLIGCTALVVSVAIWLGNGGAGDLVGSGARGWLALGRLSGLLAALAALLGLYLAARPRGLEAAFGLDRMLGWHRWVGITTVSLVAIHVVAEIAALSPPDNSGPVEALIGLMETTDWMVAAFASAALFLIIGLTSLRWPRRRLAYETWHFIHLSGYLAVLLAFGHQVTSGSDIAGSQLAVAWWTALGVGTATAIAIARWGDLGRSIARPRIQIESVESAGPGMVVLNLSGPGIARISASPGQFFLVRVLTADGWWQAHPVSLSAAPTRDSMRFTIKGLGDWSTGVERARPGTRVILEGPYGTFTTAASDGRPLLLVGGGIGVAPIRALLEDADLSQRPVVILRARSDADVAHLDEITALCRATGGTLRLVTGPRNILGERPFGPSKLRHMVPDIADRHVYVCGPQGFEDEVVASARSLGVPRESIRRERFRV